MTRALQPFEIDAGCGLVANIAACCDSAGIDPAVPPTTPEDEARLEGAKALAVETLNLLTAGMVANCPVTLRPCNTGCCIDSDLWLLNGLMWYPRNLGFGVWVNSCGCQSPCGCERVDGLDLVGPYAEVLSVSVDGTALGPTDYTLIDGRWLYRTTGSWPTTQDMDAMPGQPGTFAIEARPGYPLGPQGERVLGRLVCEYMKAICGQKCELPPRVQAVTREGVTMVMGTDLFEAGMSGVREVDVYVQSLNPNSLRVMPVVVSPDVPGRV